MSETLTPDTTARREPAEADADKQLLWRMLVRFAGAGICTPEKGYPHWGHLMPTIDSACDTIADLRARNARLERELLDLRESQRVEPDGDGRRRHGVDIPTEAGIYAASSQPRVTERHGCSRCAQGDAEAARYDQDVARMVHATERTD